MAWPSKRSVLDAIERAVDAPARWLRYAVTGVDDGDEKQNARFRGLVVLGGPLIGVLGLRLASHAPGAALVVRSVTRPPRALGAGLRARPRMTVGAVATLGVLSVRRAREWLDEVGSAALGAFCESPPVAWALDQLDLHDVDPMLGAVSLVALATGVRYHRAARRALAEVAGAYFAVVRLALRFVRDPRAYGTWYRLVVCLASDPDPLRANLEFLLRVLDEKQAKRG
jgi:hypothetical protein